MLFSWSLPNWEQLIWNSSQECYIYRRNSTSLETDTFVYQIRDNDGLVSNATVSIQIIPVPSAIIAYDYTLVLSTAESLHSLRLDEEQPTISSS
jgi:hypothetical protein